MGSINLKQKTGGSRKMGGREVRLLTQMSPAVGFLVCEAYLSAAAKTSTVSKEPSVAQVLIGLNKKSPESDMGINAERSEK